MKLTPLALGALGGYLYWYFVGCASGSCPISSHWHTSVLYGTLVGATFLLPSKKRGAGTGGTTDDPTSTTNSH